MHEQTEDRKDYISISITPPVSIAEPNITLRDKKIIEKAERNRIKDEEKQRKKEEKKQQKLNKLKERQIRKQMEADEVRLGSDGNDSEDIVEHDRGSKPNSRRGSKEESDGKQREFHLDQLEGRTLVEMLEHYGLMIEDMEGNKSSIHELWSKQTANVRLIGIGCGSKTAAQKFIQEVGWAGEMYVDHRRGSFNALEFPSMGIADLFDLRLYKEIRLSMREGFGINVGLNVGNITQLGGAIVAHPGSGINYLYRSTRAYEHAPISSLLAACSPPISSSEDELPSSSLRSPKNTTSGKTSRGKEKKSSDEECEDY